MRNFYDEMWADAISKILTVRSSRGMWKFYCMTYISMAMALNLFLSVVMLNLGISIPFYPFDVSFTSVTIINGFLSFFFSYLLLPISINYFFIFRKQRYKQLLEKYPPRNGRYFAIYFIGTIISLFAYFAIAFVLLKFRH